MYKNSLHIVRGVLFVTWLFSFLLLASLHPQVTHAQVWELPPPLFPDSCGSWGISVTSQTVDGKTYIANDNANNRFSVNVTGIDPNNSYELLVAYIGTDAAPSAGVAGYQIGTTSGNNVTFNVSDPNFFKIVAAGEDNAKYNVQLVRTDASGGNRLRCTLNLSYSVKLEKYCKTVEIFQDRNIGDADGDGQPDMCFWKPGGAGCVDDNFPLSIRAVIMEGTQPSMNDLVTIELSGSVRDGQSIRTNNDGSIAGTFSVRPGDLKIRIQEGIGLITNIDGCSRDIQISDSCNSGDPVASCSSTPPVVPPGGGPPGAAPGTPDTFNFCSQINDPNLKQACLQCAGGEKGYEGVWTAIGCIRREPEAIVRKFMVVGISMGGGVALLTFLAAGFILSTSQGNTQQIDQAKQMLTASISGLLFIIFSVGILEYIGYSILGIPGFGG